MPEEFAAELEKAGGFRDEITRLPPAEEQLDELDEIMRPGVARVWTPRMRERQERELQEFDRRRQIMMQQAAQEIDIEQARISEMHSINSTTNTMLRLKDKELNETRFAEMQSDSAGFYSAYEEIDPRSPDYNDQVRGILMEFPAATQSPAVDALLRNDGRVNAAAMQARGIGPYGKPPTEYESTFLRAGLPDSAINGLYDAEGNFDYRRAEQMIGELEREGKAEPAGRELPARAIRIQEDMARKEARLAALQNQLGSADDAQPGARNKLNEEIRELQGELTADEAALRFYTGDSQPAAQQEQPQGPQRMTGKQFLEELEGGKVPPVKLEDFEDVPMSVFQHSDGGIEFRPERRHGVQLKGTTERADFPVMTREQADRLKEQLRANPATERVGIEYFWNPEKVHPDPDVKEPGALERF